MSDESVSVRVQGAPEAVERAVTCLAERFDIIEAHKAPKGAGERFNGVLRPKPMKPASELPRRPASESK